MNVSGDEILKEHVWQADVEQTLIGHPGQFVTAHLNVDWNFVQFKLLHPKAPQLKMRLLTFKNCQYHMFLEQNYNNEKKLIGWWVCRPEIMLKLQAVGSDIISQ